MINAKFDHKNCLVIFNAENKKTKHYIAIPPGKNKVDIWSPKGFKQEGNYLCDVDCIIIMSSDIKRTAYHDNQIIAEINL